MRRTRLGRQQTAAEQPAATQTHEQTVQRAHLVKQLQRRRALAAQHIGMVKRWNKRHAALGCQALRDRHGISGQAKITKIAIEQNTSRQLL